MKHQVLKIGFFAAFFALLTAGVIAQPTLPNTPTPPTAAHWTEFTDPPDGESIDSVTVGSRMPYRVDAQTPIPGLDYEYKWLFSTSPALTIQSLSLTPSNLTQSTVDAVTDYYSENEISVVMPSTPGLINITTNVRALIGGGTVALPCTGLDVIKDIRVLPRPTIQWVTPPDSIIECAPNLAAIPNVTIPVTLSGNREFEVAYTITHYAGYISGGTVTSTTSGYKVLTGNSVDLIGGTDLTAHGLYEITITNITDRISRKSLDMSLVASQSTDLPAAPYKVYIYPAPVTNPLQHIRNM